MEWKKGLGLLFIELKYIRKCKKRGSFPTELPDLAILSLLDFIPPNYLFLFNKRCIVSTRNSVFHLIKETIKQISHSAKLIDVVSEL